MAARAKVRQVFGVDANQLKLEFSVAELKPEISFAYAALFLDVFLDAGLYIGCYDS